MKAICRRIALVGLGTVLGACAARQAPPVQRYALGMARAEYRDYAGAKASPCDAEPRWLSDELTAVNGLLSRFLKGTEKAATPDALEHPAHLELLQEALRTLPPVLAVHRGNLTALQGCGFRRSGAFPEIAQRGTALVKEAQSRLDDAPQALAAAQLREARQKWRDEAPEREAAARGTWCSKDPQVGQPDLYYARQLPEGRTEWLFCDGHRVEQSPGGEPTLQSPEGLTRRERRRVQPQRYLDAASSYPTEEVDRQPRAASSVTGSGSTAGAASGAR